MLNEAPCFVAIDLGTTTISAVAVSAKGDVLAKAVELNVQRNFGSDVISRIQAATSGPLPLLRNAVVKQIDKLCNKMLDGNIVKCTVLAGNTIMLHMIFGANCAGLGVFPYTPDFLCAREEIGAFWGWSWTKEVITPPCIHTYCGADITAGLLALEATPKPYLLADFGTNAELALVTEYGIFVTSAAAGPVFEGTGISCGMPALSGAICGFSLIGASVKITTLDGKPPLGICASGLIDIIAQLRRTYLLKANGFLAKDYELTPEITLTQKDIRRFQLAKAAVSAGIKLLCRRGEVDMATLNIIASGALGSALDLKNAASLGLFGASLGSKPKSYPNANTSSATGSSVLDGAIKYALSLKAREQTEKIVRDCQYIELSLLPEFQQVLLDSMDF